MSKRLSWVSLIFAAFVVALAGAGGVLAQGGQCW
jgi:hypothetical protein